MSHARIEEVSDSDPEIDDPSDYLPQSDNAIIRQVAPLSQRQQQQEDAANKAAAQNAAMAANPTLSRGPPPPAVPSQANIQKSREAIKYYCTLYPCYFSSSRTRSQGRRVSKNLSVPNPLAFNILHAVQHVIQPDRNRIHIAFEPDKTHPKDWSNPGRVRVELFDRETHSPKHPTVHNKEFLYQEVAKYLKEHPTKESDALELKIQGLPTPDKVEDLKAPRPRGWGTMNEILPLHSPAVSGGGVREDFFKEAMAELAQAQGGAGAGAGGADGGMAGLQQMMSSMGGMGGLQGLMGGGGGGGAGESSSTAGKKKKDKKK